jgi:hypothetical protein
MRLRWAGLLLVGVVACAGCAGSPAAVTAKGTVTISEQIDSGAVTGTPTVADLGTTASSVYDKCTGNPKVTPPNGDITKSVPGQYRDLTPGATVTVRDDGLKIVGLGHLGTAPERIRYANGEVALLSSLPKSAGPDQWTGTIFCEMPFTVKDVAGGSKYYTVEIARQAAVSVPANGLNTIDLKFGS